MRRERIYIGVHSIFCVMKAVPIYNKICFLNFGTVFFTAMKMMKSRKAHCSPPLVGEDNSMVFTSHWVPFPATNDWKWHGVRSKTIELSKPNSGGEQ